MAHLQDLTTWRSRTRADDVMRCSARRIEKAVLCVILALLSALTTTQPGLAQSEPLVRVSPARLEVSEYGVSTVEIRVDDVEGLYAFDIRLEFDPMVVEVADADGALDRIQVTYGGLLNPDFVARNEADNDAGTVWVAMTQMNPSEAVTGSGAAFVVTLRGKRAGAKTPLAITHAQLVTRHGEEIPAATSDGEITVVDTRESPLAPTKAPTRQPVSVTPTPTSTSGSEGTVAEAPAPTIESAAVITPRTTPPPSPTPSRQPTAPPIMNAGTDASTETPVEYASAHSDPASTPVVSAARVPSEGDEAEGVRMTTELPSATVGTELAGAADETLTTGPPAARSASFLAADIPLRSRLPRRLPLWTAPIIASVGVLLSLGILCRQRAKAQRGRRGTSERWREEAQ